jgi:hypothetical protein
VKEDHIASFFGVAADLNICDVTNIRVTCQEPNNIDDAQSKPKSLPSSTINSDLPVGESKYPTKNDNISQQGTPLIPTYHKQIPIHDDLNDSSHVNFDTVGSTDMPLREQENDMVDLHKNVGASYGSPKLESAIWSNFDIDSNDNENYYINPQDSKNESCGNMQKKKKSSGMEKQNVRGQCTQSKSGIF